MMTNTRRFLCCLLSVLLIVCCAMFTACTPKDVDNTEPSTEAATAATTTAETELATTENATATIKLSDSYVPTKAFDKNGSEVGLDSVYGSGLRDYGGSLCFKADGTFTTFIGVYGNTDNESGTYKIVSDTEIEMTYNNDTVKTAIVTQTDSDDNVTELRMPHRNHDVVFTQE